MISPVHVFPEAHGCNANEAIGEESDRAEVCTQPGNARQFQMIHMRCGVARGGSMVSNAAQDVVRSHAASNCKYLRG